MTLQFLVCQSCSHPAGDNFPRGKRSKNQFPWLPKFPSTRFFRFQVQTGLIIHYHLIEDSILTLHFAEISESHSLKETNRKLQMLALIRALLIASAYNL